ncbi:MAG: hypothetical protein SV598_08485 [Pseudomonadota bacterium]|nr:hypothetical protein [Pseudomonadota bacterium]
MLRNETQGNVIYRIFTCEHYALAYHYLEQANSQLALTILLDLVQFADREGLDGTTYFPANLKPSSSRAPGYVL